MDPSVCLIGLFGMAVQNGLVLISQTKGLIAEGLPFDTALRAGVHGCEPASSRM
jgi:hypothetical protein